MQQLIHGLMSAVSTHCGIKMDDMILTDDVG